MQMVIEIPKWFKEMIDKGETPSDFPLWLAYGIHQGIVLPKGHGRLIDADLATRQCLKSTGKRLLALDTAPTVIDADRSDK